MMDGQGPASGWHGRKFSRQVGGRPRGPPEDLGFFRDPAGGWEPPLLTPLPEPWGAGPGLTPLTLAGSCRVAVQCR